MALIFLVSTLKGGAFMLVRIFFVRHGESEGNLTDRFYDSPEVRLTEVGRLQAMSAGKALKDCLIGVGVSDIYCSPWLRARETCVIALREAGIQTRDVKIDIRLRERSFAGLVGKRINWDGMFDGYEDAISAKDYQDIWTYGHPKSKNFGIETLPDLRRRTNSFLREISKKGVSDSRREKSAVVFSHGGIGRMFRAICQDWPDGGKFNNLIFPKNGEVMKLEYRA